MSATNRPPAAAAPDLTTLAATVLGDLSYLLADDTPAPPATSLDGLVAEVRYSGAARGRLRCWCTRGFAEKLAANLLAVEPNADQAQREAEDALREFMNVLCGQLVTSWHDSRGVYDLSIPTVRAGSPPPDMPDAVAKHVCRLWVEGEILRCAYERE
jgi:hypothetical protein